MSYFMNRPYWGLLILIFTSIKSSLLTVKLTIRINEIMRKMIFLMIEVFLLYLFLPETCKSGFNNHHPTPITTAKTADHDHHTPALAGSAARLKPPPLLPSQHRNALQEQLICWGIQARQQSCWLGNLHWQPRGHPASGVSDHCRCGTPGWL